MDDKVRRKHKHIAYMVAPVVKRLNIIRYKSGSSFTFCDKMWVDVHKLTHITNKQMWEHVFGKRQIAPVSKGEFKPIVNFHRVLPTHRFP